MSIGPAGRCCPMLVCWLAPLHRLPKHTVNHAMTLTATGPCMPVWWVSTNAPSAELTNPQPVSLHKSSPSAPDRKPRHFPAAAVPGFKVSAHLLQTLPCVLHAALPRPSSQLSGSPPTAAL